MTKTFKEEAEKILTKAFNDIYDYITEKDIIKAAHEYSEKTTFKEASVVLQQLHDAEVAKLADMIFIDFPTGHALTVTSSIHEEACSSKQGFICDCSVIQAAQFAVDKAKERVLAALQTARKDSE